ncbi:unnamed protein product [Ceutorhynchus assimilis]|uniref:Uncharacterized protein n=1 Tax=Ceutorhynchus assimilis TaxID=467358 RepID=A0A9N9MKB9_9CUCU|nr:unnamed protein product [Ceutorhynchus assimilis]
MLIKNCNSYLLSLKPGFDCLIIGSPAATGDGMRRHTVATINGFRSAVLTSSVDSLANTLLNNSKEESCLGRFSKSNLNG